MAADTPVLVVGAGPTGLLLAAELHRRGVGCRLIDAQPGPMHWDRATVVHPRSLEVFESLGILEPFLAAGVKQRAARLHSEGSLLGEIDLSTCGSRHGYNLGLSEEVTESILTDYLRQQGGDVIRSHRLATLEHHREGVLAGIECDGSQEEVTFQWVVGCDGLHSITRQLAGIGMAGRDIPEPWAVFDATASGWTEAFDVNYVYLDEIPVIMTALPDRRWRVYLRPTSSDSDLVVDATASIRRYQRDLDLNDISNPNRFHCHTKVATRFQAGPILLAGDAAHVCSPSQGHGMNSGIQDAVNLAWKLALVCRGNCSTTLLDSYEAERRPVAEMIARSGDEAERAHTLTDPADRQARNESLRSVYADPALRHQEVIAEAELNIDYGDSPIVMGDSNGALSPGQLLPDTIEIRLGSGEVGLLHDLADRTGHTALLVGGSSSHPEDLARLDLSVRSAVHPSLMEAIIVATAHVAGPEHWARLDPRAADRLGVTGITLLAVRPDGYIGLRADQDHLEALAAYQGMLGSRPS